MFNIIQNRTNLNNCSTVNIDGDELKEILDDIREDIDENEQYNFTLQRKRIYLNGDLKVTCELPAEHSPTQESIITSFTLVVREQEA